MGETANGSVKGGFGDRFVVFVDGRFETFCETSGICFSGCACVRDGFWLIKGGLLRDVS